MTKTSALTLLSLFATPALSAAVVSTDFNDNTLGALGSFTAGSGQQGGTGFASSATWEDTGTISVISGDLTAPSSTNYAITQGSAVGSHRVQNQTNFSPRQNTRELATPLGTSSDVWFSFLLNQPTTNSRGGITFNQNTSAPGNPRVVATGTDVRLGLGATLQPAGGGAAMSLNSDTLLLGQLIIDTTGDETLNLWVNPDVSGGITGLGPVDTSLSVDTAILDPGVTRLGVQSYSSDSQGGIVDALILSDAADPNQAFADVTGVLIPEPSSLALSLVAFLGLLRRRRYR